MSEEKLVQLDWQDGWTQPHRDWLKALIVGALIVGGVSGALWFFRPEWL